MNEGKVIYEKTGRIGRITFDNQPALNALTWQMWRDLGSICTEVAKDRDVRVVIFRGAGGKAFISGTDISGFVDFDSGQRGIDYEREMDSYVSAVENMPQATIAVVEGWAAGGGLAISCACDFRIASTTAKFGSPLAKTIGNLVSAKGYARLVATVGPAIVKRMIMYGEFLTAAEMQSLGLLLRVVEPEHLNSTVEEVAERLASHAPLTIQATKDAIRRIVYGNLPDIDDLIAMIYGSEDFKIGVRSFLEKKKPEWTGR